MSKQAKHDVKTLCKTFFSSCHKVKNEKEKGDFYEVFTELNSAMDPFEIHEEIPSERTTSSMNDSSNDPIIFVISYRSDEDKLSVDNV